VGKAGDAGCSHEETVMTMIQKGMMIGGVILFGFFLYLLSPILTPFLVAGLLAYLGDPLVNRIERLKVPRTVGVIIVFLMIFTLILVGCLLLFPMLGRQIALVINRLPAFLNWIQQTGLPWVYATFGIEQLNIQELINIDSVKTAIAEHWREAGSMAVFTWKAVSHSGHVVLIWLMNLILVPVVTFYLLRDWDRVLGESSDLLPRSIEPTVTKLFSECNEIVGAFFRGQLMVMLVVGLFYSLGLWFVGLDLALLIGIVAGLLSIIPYLGFILGMLLACIATLYQFHDATHLFYVLGVFTVGHVIEAMWLTPMLVGDRIGLHPVAVIFAILAGGQLFGFIGVLLALPVAAVIMVLLRHAGKHYKGSGLYRRKG
jgi:predicted PurR-regulated permease PerM